MAANGIDIGSIMQAGGWQSETMVARYIANLEAARSGMSRLWQLRQKTGRS